MVVYVHPISFIRLNRHSNVTLRRLYLRGAEPLDADKVAYAIRHIDDNNSCKHSSSVVLP